MSLAFSWSHLFGTGGPILLVLLICFIVTLVIIIERTSYFRARNKENEAILAEIKKQEESGQVLPRESYQMLNTPVSYVLSDCYSVDSSLFDEVKTRAIAEKSKDFERYLGTLATLGTVSPYLGLLGTVFGIIRAFVSLGGGENAMSGLNTGIAESLTATAAGLFVAIPATIAFNHFRKMTDEILTGIEIAASRLKVLLHKRATRS